MSTLPDRKRLLAAAVLASASLTAAAPPAPRPPAEPAKVVVSVSPESVPPGGRAEVTLRLTPSPGVKINRYPKVKLSVPARAGLASGGETAVGNDGPPPADTSPAASNYFDTVDPVRVALAVDPTATPGKHELDGNLTYFYCVTASGFCAPSRTKIKIPLDVR